MARVMDVLLSLKKGSVIAKIYSLAACVSLNHSFPLYHFCVGGLPELLRIQLVSATCGK